MSKQLVIECSRMVLVIDESELVKALPENILVNAISKGKGLKRSQSTAMRQSQGFNRWHLYETLKGNRIIEDVTINAIEAMPVTELREGLIEFLLTKRRSH